MSLWATRLHLKKKDNIPPPTVLPSPNLEKVFIPVTDTIVTKNSNPRITPKPTPTPTPTQPPAPCNNCTLYTGYISYGGYAYQPNGTYYYSTASGYHKGWLQGLAGTDFDLYLKKWNGSSWATVASSAGTTSVESISYYGTAGYYMWEIDAYSGSGNYNFWLKKP